MHSAAAIQSRIHVLLGLVASRGARVKLREFENKKLNLRTRGLNAFITVLTQFGRHMGENHAIADF